jgi:hypothetical protein
VNAVFEILSRCPTPLLIAGGHALEAHGVSRQTLDVDLLLAADDARAVDEFLTSAGFRQVAANENFARYAPETSNLAEVDLLFVDAETFEKMRASAVPLQRLGREFRAPSLEHLIALKLHAVRNNPLRASRDLRDISELLRLNPGKISQETLSGLCDRFGPPDIFSRLEEMTA